ncbi:phage baseplate assembly protein V [Methanosarcina sp.]|uniref:phage baseplate assembly protein V n=1 Tax=Methanosarcina sp. TaxID=2213 RepID=UPI003C709D74
MSLLDIVLSSETKVNGVVVGIVTNNKDPDGLGRVKVKFPWLSNQDESDWVRISSPMAGKERGIFILPDVNDEVLVVFEHGDINRPYIIGSLWNGKDKPPETNSDGKNNIKIIKSRSGHTIKIDDTEGEEKIEIVDKGEENKICIDSSKKKIEVVDKSGENKICIDSSNKKISIECGGDIELSATKGKIAIKAKEIEINSTSSAEIKASAGMDLKASGTMKIKGSMVNIN